MKLSTLIKKLLKVQSEVEKDPEVIIDYDENGFFGVEKVTELFDEETDRTYINLKSTNEM